MSSNLQLNRICVFCQNDFIAMTTTTKYCSKVCNNRHYKQRQRESKIEKSNEVTSRIKTKRIEDLSNLEFLTVTQAASLLNCSRQNIYKLINTGKLEASNILLKKTLIKRQDIESMFKSKEQRQFENLKSLEPIIIDFDKCIPLKEIQMIYGISSKGLYSLIQRHNIPKIRYNKKILVPNNIVEHFIKN